MMMSSKSTLSFDAVALKGGISGSYLLVINIPCYIDAEGARWVDMLWHKDLLEHVRYIDRLVLAAPRSTGTMPADATLLNFNGAAGTLAHVDLPQPRNALHALLQLPTTAARLWRAIGQSAVVHAGVAGWPYPLGWLAAPVARLRRKPLVIVVESAPWRGERGSLKQRGRGWVYERMARWCVRLADIRFFTTAEYRRSMLGEGEGHVIPASWIDETNIFSDDEARQAWDAKPASPLRIVFAARLTAAKGLGVLLDAMRELAQRDVPVELSIYGQGEMLTQCEAISAELTGRTRVLVRGTLPYDRTFFQALRPHHALIVPSVSDEQPRIVYDGFAQAVPTIGSDTGGLRQCVRPDVNGILIAPNDPKRLAEAIERAAANPALLRQMGLNGLETARQLTHSAMHRRRLILLREALDKLPRR